MPRYTREEFMREFDIDEAGVEAAGERLHAYMIGWHLAQLREKAGVTQVELAQRLGVNQSRISAIENGDPDVMSLATLRTYIEALGGTLQLTATINNHQFDIPAII